MLVEAAHEELNLHERVLSQALVLFAKLQVADYPRQKVVSSDGRFPGKDIPLHVAGGPGPAKKRPQALLDRSVMLGFKAIFAPIGSRRRLSAAMMADPVIDKVAVLFWPKLLQGFQAEAGHKALQAR
jgi:hypothetical protein